MIAQIYTELNDDGNALANYELANKIDPGKYNNIKPLLNIYVKSDHRKTKETAIRFFNFDPANPTIYNELEGIFYSNKKVNDLINFYQEQLTLATDNPIIEGNLNFYLGKIYIDIDKKLAEKYFLNAKEIFNTVYSKGHPVFKAIDDGLNLIKQ